MSEKLSGFGNFSGLITGTRATYQCVVGLWAPGQTAMHQRNIKLNHTFACRVALRLMARRVCRNLQQCCQRILIQAHTL